MSADNTGKRNHDDDMEDASKKQKFNNGNNSDDDEFHPYDGYRLLTKDMYGKFFEFIGKFPKKERRYWMGNFFDMVESHQGCLSNDKHYYYADEEPEMYKDFIDSLRTGDMKKFSRLKCFELGEDDFHEDDF